MYNGQQQFTALLRDSKCKERKQVMSYSVQNIRNVCLLGHGGNGKTSLAESMLYLTGGTDRLGNPVDGNTVCDYDPEEIRRQISISTAVAPVEYNGCKINVLDTPGYFDFSGEVIEALQVSDAAIIVCSAKGGMSVGAEKAWKLCQQRKLPRVLYISKTDEDNSDYNAAFDTLRERFGKNIAPVAAPIWDANKKVIGFIDVLHKRAFEAGPKGERVEIDVPDDKKPVLDELYDALKESVAETSEELMDKYFAGEDFTYAEMIQGLRPGVRDLSLFPVVCGSASPAWAPVCCWTPLWSCSPPPGGPSPHGRERDGRAGRVRGLPRRAALRPGVEDRVRPVRQVLLCEGALRQPEARYADGQLPHRRHREAGPPVRDEGQEGRGSQGAGVRRHRRHRQDG